MYMEAICDGTVLEGRHVRLEPLALRHADDLRKAVPDEDAWALWYSSVPTPDAVVAEVDGRMAAAGVTMVPYAVVDRGGGRAIGMTGYCALDPKNRRLEVGGTWIAERHRRSLVNTDGKQLLLARAFDVLDCVAVEFRTHFMDRRARRSVERLGARLDGVLRAHVVALDGSLRDTCVYSVTASEWPAVRSNLRALMS